MSLQGHRSEGEGWYVALEEEIEDIHHKDYMFIQDQTSQDLDLPKQPQIHTVLRLQVTRLEN